MVTPGRASWRTSILELSIYFKPSSSSAEAAAAKETILPMPGFVLVVIRCTLCSYSDVPCAHMQRFSFISPPFPLLRHTPYDVNVILIISENITSALDIFFFGG